MDIAILVIVGVLLFVGLVGTVLPALPGTGLMFFGMALYAGYFGWETVGWPVLTVLLLLTLLTFLMDYVASAYGAKKFGGSKYAAYGAAVGGLLGFLVFNVIGLLLGVFAGALAGELLFAKKDWNAALQSGQGALVGFVGGTIAKLLVGLLMLGLFLWKALLS